MLNRNAVQRHLPQVWLEQSCKDRQQRGFPGTVRADDGNKFSGLRMQRDFIENAAPSTPHRDLRRIENGHEPPRIACKSLARSSTAAFALSTTPQLYSALG